MNKYSEDNEYFESPTEVEDGEQKEITEEDIKKTIKKFEEEISSDYYIKRFPTSRRIGHVTKQD